MRRWPLDGLAILAAVVATMAAASTVDRPPAPFAPPGHWRDLWNVALIASILLYAAAVYRSRRRPAPLLPIFLIAAAIQLSPLAGPLLHSTDAFAYWAYARIAVVHDSNPYTDPPTEFPTDPYVTALGDGLGPVTSVYGPAFTLASEAHARAAGDSSRTAELLYRITAALGVLLLTAIAARVAARPTLAVVMIGWSPLFALHFGGGGHNDIWMLLPILGALLLAQRGRAAAAGAAWTLAAMVKASALVFLPLELVARARTDRRRATLMLAGLIAAAAALALVFTARYGPHWAGSFTRALDQSRQTSSISVGFLLEHRFGLSPRWTQLLLTGVFAAGYVFLLREAWRGRARLGLAAGLLLLTSTWLMAWYTAWAIALSAVEEDRVAQTLAVALTGYVVYDSLPFPKI